MMQMYKEAILQQTTEADIFRHYVPGFEGKTASFTSPLTPDEKHPSLSIYQHQDGKGWRFSGKNTGHEGDVFELVASLKNLDSKSQFLTVCEAIAQDMNLTLPEATSATREKIWQVTTFPEFTPDFVAYWQQWGVTPEILKQYGVKQAETCNYNGKIYTHQGRKASLFTGSEGRRKIKVPSTPEKPKSDTYKEPAGPAYIFGLEQVPEGTETLILCEGEKDVLALAAAGFAAVTVGSATDKITAAHLERIKADASRVFICYDRDAAGETGSARMAKETGFIRVLLPDMEAGKDVADYFAAGHTAADFSALLESVANEAGEKKNSGDLGTVKNQDDKTQEGSEKGGTPAVAVESEFVKYALGNTRPTAAEVRDLYKPLTDKDGNIKGIEVNPNRFYERLKSFGFTRFDLPDDTPIIVHVKDNIVTQVRPTQVEDVFFAWLNRAPETIEGYAREDVYNKFLKGNDSYFSEKKLNRLGLRPLAFKTDTRTETFFYFRNGFVRATKDNYRLHPYSELNGQIWRDQIRDFDFTEQFMTPPQEAGIFARFLYNVCKHTNQSEAKRKERFDQLLIVAGYMMHHYFDGVRVMPILTDSSLSAGDNGGSGKTLFLKALAQMKPTDLIDGKSFKPRDDKHVFQTVRQQHQIVGLNDVPRGFEVEPIYTAITEGIKVEPKGKPPYFINAKMIVTSNAAVIPKGGSDRRRILDFEFSDHYNEGHTPQNDFPEKHFFAPDEKLFSAQDWTDFFNLMCYAASLYHMAGLPKVETINLDRRRLEQETNADFINWMNDRIGQGKIKMSEWINKATMHNDFLSAYPDYEGTRFLGKQRHFTDCIRKYKAHSPTLKNHNEEQEKRSDKDQFIKFLPA
jgi:5S rRNA maturation endonuclease (ribonuclease M5)